jgi:hypothetical protein
MDKQNNDALRASIPQVSPPNRLLFTRGVIALGVEDVHEILMKVKNFDDFNESNDPYGEHDFGSFNHKGEEIFWKIDDYEGMEGYNLILTIMLAEEY